ncbi:MAG: RluA family pseudouridine synthase [Clostridiales bacterium]|jgi:23S rRNA pseudouridine955/2504/2580 synthase|nr:RluA family pseudouridine synthase [Clostridiales bacterium]
MREFEVLQGEGGRRLDKHLSKILGNAPMPLVQKFLRKKLIKLNGAKANGQDMIQDGDRIQVWLSDDFVGELVTAPKEPQSSGNIRAVYEDADILVANKPPGLLTQPSKPGGEEDTLNRRLLAYLAKKGQFTPREGSAFAPACCNRLDRNTSGLVMCAKNLAASQELSKAFAQGKVNKIYIAAMLGRIDKEQLLEGFIDRNEETFESLASGDAGKPAAMRVWPVAYGQGFTVARIQLLTGRTHQIRAFGKEMGHPILGDPKYGDASENARLARVHGVRYQLLHAEKMTYNADEGKLKGLCGMEWEAPPHGLFMKFLEKENAVPKARIR